MSSAALNPGAECCGQAQSSGSSSRAGTAVKVEWCECGIAELCGKHAAVVFARPWLRSSPLCCLPLAVGRVPVPTYINRALLHFYLKRLCSFQIIACSASQSTFSFFRSHSTGFKGGSGLLLLQWEERDKRAELISVNESKTLSFFTILILVLLLHIFYF